MEAYLIHVATLTLIYIIMTMSFNLAVGYTGLVNFGHIGLMGIGGYAAAILTKYHDFNFFVAIFLAGIISAIAAAVLALPSRKIKGDYYALVTLGFLFLANATFINWESLTRGTLGIPGILRPEGFGSGLNFFILTLATTLIIYFFLDRVTKSPFGRALEAVRDDEDVASALGKNVFKIKIISMTISGFMVGISGAYLAHFIQFIAPQSFWLTLVVWSLAGMMLGGVASIKGSVLGVVILMLILEPLRFLELPSAIVGPTRLTVLMLILLGVILCKPRGIMGRADLEQ